MNLFLLTEEGIEKIIFPKRQSLRTLLLYSTGSKWKPRVTGEDFKIEDVKMKVLKPEMINKDIKNKAPKVSPVMYSTVHTYKNVAPHPKPDRPNVTKSNIYGDLKKKIQKIKRQK